MLKRAIKYVDFDDNEQEDIFYFNLSKSELMELEAGEDGVSFSGRLNRIIESKDVGVIIDEIKALILLAYGVKSLDGKSFIKNDELRQEFLQSAAFDALFIELSQDAEAAVVFLSGVMPKDMAKEYEKVTKETKDISDGTLGLPTAQQYQEAMQNRSAQSGGTE